MKETMQSKISRFNDYAISANVNSMPIGLFCGKIGLSIYFFHQAKETNNIGSSSNLMQLQLLFLY